jgi:hypothetical protein
MCCGNEPDECVCKTEAQKNIGEMVYDAGLKKTLEECEDVMFTPAIEDGLYETIKDIGRSAGEPMSFGPGSVRFVEVPDSSRLEMVGDLDSDERGTGARANAGKTPLELIPVRIWSRVFGQALNDRGQGATAQQGELLVCVRALAEFQEGKGNGSELLSSIPAHWFVFASYVMAYGLKKYKPWNWLKGQAWSVPIASALRHAWAVFIDEEELDHESGLLHIGHFTCKLIFLAMFYDTYPEGNDLPREEYFNGSI